MIIRVQNGTISDDLYEDMAHPSYAKAHGLKPMSRTSAQGAICSKKACDVCGESLWTKDFIMWSGFGGEIAICGNCAEHTIAGLSRDVYELNGHEVIVKKGSPYGVECLKSKIAQLQTINLEYANQILEIQETLARRK